MKIGVMFSDQSPQIGGGFTFEEGILDSFVRLKKETPHEIVMLGVAEEKPPFAASFPWVSLQRPPPGQEDNCRRLLDFEHSPHLAAAGIDLIVYLNPFVTPYVDLPFIVNIWDLAHRITPFFPEVSLAGEWSVREALFRQRLQRAAYVTVTNETGKQEIIDFYQVPGSKIRPLHLPTPEYALEGGPAGSLEHLGIGDDFLFYPAQFWPHKNHLLLLRMLVILRDKHGYTPQLVLTGADKPIFNHSAEGNMAFIRQRTQELALEKQVIFAGFVLRQDIISLYRRATALVFPSYFGPENIPPLEAFALGCPVIAGAIPGADEQYGDAALKVDPTRPELWADAVQQLRQDAGLRKSLLAQGAIRARKYTSDDFARGLFEIFEEFEAYRCNWPSRLQSPPPEPPPMKPAPEEAP